MEYILFFFLPLAIARSDGLLPRPVEERRRKRGTGEKEKERERLCDAEARSRLIYVDVTVLDCESNARNATSPTSNSVRACRASGRERTRRRDGEMTVTWRASAEVKIILSLSFSLPPSLFLSLHLLSSAGDNRGIITETSVLSVRDLPQEDFDNCRVHACVNECVCA